MVRKCEIRTLAQRSQPTRGFKEFMQTNPPIPMTLALACFQPGEGPSRVLLRDCEIFANLRLKL